ncbi:MAG: protein kinase [Gemmatimonadales bacterium]|nr:protein kinase [Gemmatimonadales bacterium]
MTYPKLIAQPRKDTSAELGTSAGRGRLPYDLLRQASRRLEVMALIGAALWVLGPALARLALYTTNPADPRITRLGDIDFICALGVFISLALFFYLRKGERDPALVMDLGLVYMVVTALDVGLMIHWGPASATPILPTPMISWIGPVILMFAAIVPSPPWKMAVAGFVAASMDPLGMLIGRAAGVYRFDSALDTLVMHYPNYLLLGVAVVISGVVTRLGQQVSRERELGSYRLGELLGRGGMGEVYRATHRMLARPAAIKLIRAEVFAAGNGAKAQLATVRFRREAEAAARLRSPHTVALYDFGVTEEGRLYLVMELLEGSNLETLVRRHGPLPG